MPSVLRHAFFLSSRVPLLGDIPWNVVAVATALGLGFIHPGFWLIGLGLETAYLVTLTTNKRFQKLVAAESLGASRDQAIASLRTSLPSDLQAVHDRLQHVASKALAARKDFVTGNDAVTDLPVIALRLLTAKHQLRTVIAETDERALRTRIEQLTTASENDPAVRSSQEATRDLIGRRLATLQRNQDFLRRIDADLERIEAQLNLALEEASGGAGRDLDLTIGLDLAGRLLDEGVYGDAGAAVASLAGRQAVAQ